MATAAIKLRKTASGLWRFERDFSQGNELMALQLSRATGLSRDPGKCLHWPLQLFGLGLIELTL